MRVMLGGDHWMLILRRTFPTKPSNFQCLINISAPKKTQKLGEKLLQGITEWKLAGLPQCTARVYNTHTHTRCEIVLVADVAAITASYSWYYQTSWKACPPNWQIFTTQRSETMPWQMLTIISRWLIQNGRIYT